MHITWSFRPAFLPRRLQSGYCSKHKQSQSVKRQQSPSDAEFRRITRNLNVSGVSSVFAVVVCHWISICIVDSARARAPPRRRQSLGSWPNNLASRYRYTLGMRCGHVTNRHQCVAGKPRGARGDSRRRSRLRGAGNPTSARSWRRGWAADGCTLVGSRRTWKSRRHEFKDVKPREPSQPPVSRPCPPQSRPAATDPN